MKTVECNECGRRVLNCFRSKWRHMVRYHPDHMVKRILPLVFLPADELRQIGVDVAHSLMRGLKK